MKVTVEFYRIRDHDDAHAIIGRETLEAESRDVAIRDAQVLARTLSMPQIADGMSLAGPDGEIFHTENLHDRSQFEEKNDG